MSKPGLELFSPAIQIYCHPGLAQGWLTRYQQRRPAFACVLGFTETALIPGISAAGATPESRQYTALADAEFLINGPQPHPRYPLPPLTAGASPVLITRAVIQACHWPTYLFNTGLPFPPSVPMIDVSGQPTRCLTTGKAMDADLVERLWEQGLAWGEKLNPDCDYLILAECVVAGTTTALAILEGLGIPARQRIGSSHVQANHRQKWHLVQQALAHLSVPYTPMELVARVGDAMQIFAAGMIIRASQQGGVLLAGGSQMLAVYALAQALAKAENLAWQPDNIVIGTTRWITEDAGADVVGLSTDLGVPLLATQLNLGQSQFPALQAYEQGFVKEGVGAGGVAIGAALSHNWTLARLANAVEQVAAAYLESQLHYPI
ncbi:nicotinate mononucleotide-dependent phosphoribosyltransferase CobT [Synechococcus sp. PCC 6312]|uniref:nicotinate mononucleotide-dependent phosphoribosyltransferase CobT n=1 Tax=Synechococcus sp. (strain ATCC 27167 / PCC 6312) TaxID=195253 RepID=UPI00029F166D|nr:TIGR00303 family protein [Synechococcus sp. PCC 6312]AFY60946.1 TIGR00303 family protein [Synechococcus sp. PCC 6312]